MTEREYRQHPAISRSELWHIRKSPAHFKEEKDNPSPPTPSLLLGQLTHAFLLTPDEVENQFAVLPDINRRTREGKAIYSEWIEENTEKVIVPAQMWEQARSIAGAVLDVPKARKLLQGLKEVPYFWKHPITEEECKCRVDCLNTSLSRPTIVEYKTAADASLEAFVRAAIKYGYDFQSGMYSQGVEQNIGEEPMFVFIVAETSPPYAVNILCADETFVAHGKDIMAELMEIYHDCKLTGNWWGYLGKDNQINTLTLPPWVQI